MDSQRQGIFITFEGPNFVGKTELVRRVGAHLSESGCDVLETKEPTSTYLGDFVRQSEETMDRTAFACLIAADRYSHINQQVLPALDGGKIVLSDRYLESSLVLQRMDGLPLDFIWQLNSRVRKPDLSIVIFAETDVLVHRKEERPFLSRFERTHTRTEELALYREAAAFLRVRGFNMLELDNGTTPIATNVRLVGDYIKHLLPSSRPNGA